MNMGPYGLEGLGGSLPSPGYGIMNPPEATIQLLIANADEAWKANLAWNDQNRDYVRYQAELRRQVWRASVSQNWLNAMIDVELGTYP